MVRKRAVLLALAGLVAACAETGPAAPNGYLDPAFNSVAAGAAGAVFTMTNDAAANEVIHYARAKDGSLTEIARYATGGMGTGAGLGNQGGLVLTSGGGSLLVVNAGSNDVSLLQRRPGGTYEVTDVEPSGGTMPISVTSHGNRVFVLNEGGAGNIAGFAVQGGNLVPIAGSIQPLGSASPDAAQIQFAPNGRWLVVTEKSTNQIVTYAVSANGTAGAPVSTTSAGATPFGFSFTSNGLLVVSEAVGGSTNAGLVSSYRIAADGSIVAVDPAVPDLQTAPCWIEITGNGKYTYTTNTGSNSISGYGIGNDGSLDLLDADGVTAMSDAGPIDAAATRGNSAFLYVLNAGGASIIVYQVGGDGSLTQVAGGIGGLPAGTNGLAAF